VSVASTAAATDIGATPKHGMSQQAFGLSIPTRVTGDPPDSRDLAKLGGGDRPHSSGRGGLPVSFRTAVARDATYNGKPPRGMTTAAGALTLISGLSPLSLTIFVYESAWDAARRMSEPPPIAFWAIIFAMLLFALLQIVAGALSCACRLDGVRASAMLNTFVT